MLFLMALLVQSNWVPRRANNNPKTIEQIHKEAQEEEQKKKVDMQNAIIERGRRGVGVGGGGAGGEFPTLLIFEFSENISTDLHVSSINIYMYP